MKMKMGITKFISKNVKEVFMKNFIFSCVVLLVVALLSGISFSDISVVSGIGTFTDFENTTSNVYGAVGVSGITINSSTAEFNYYTSYTILRYVSNRVYSYRIESIVESVTEGLLTRSVSTCTGRTTITRDYTYSGSGWVLVSRTVTTITDLRFLTPFPSLFSASSYAPGESYGAEIPVGVPFSGESTSETCSISMKVEISEIVSGIPSASGKIQEIASQIDLSSMLISSTVYEYLP